MIEKKDRKENYFIDVLYHVSVYGCWDLTMLIMLILLTATKQVNNMCCDVCKDTVPCIQTCFSLLSVEQKQLAVLFLCWSVSFSFGPELVTLKGEPCSLLICFIAEEF